MDREHLYGCMDHLFLLEISNSGSIELADHKGERRDRYGDFVGLLLACSLVGR